MVLPFPARVASGARFGTLPGSILGVFQPLRSLKTVLRSLLERPRAAQEHFRSAPSAESESPRGPPEGKIRAQKGQQEPGGLQDGSGSHLGTHLGAFLGASRDKFGWDHLGALSEISWDRLGATWGSVCEPESYQCLDCFSWFSFPERNDNTATQGQQARWRGLPSGTWITL